MLDPVVLFFLFGVAAGLLRSGLRLPPPVYDFLSMMLLITIGMKGGIELARQPLSVLLPSIAAVALMGALMPLLSMPVLRFLGRMTRADAASMAAHYGSVSVGTFAVALAFLAQRGIDHEDYMAVYVVVLEIPAIIVGVMLARGISRDTRWGAMSHEVFLGKSIVLMVGGLLIGWLAGADGLAPLKPLFFDLFKGVLSLFLLEMGLVAAQHVQGLRRHGLFLIAFGTAMPVLNACLGLGVAHLLGLSLGGSLLMATLAASASYIAVPAAFRMIVPEANPALPLAASLGVTFPFNILLGLPLYLAMAESLHLTTL